jgi:hypothetical protein
VRSAPVFGSIVNRTVPLPPPLVPAVMWTQGSPVAAVQAQPVNVDTDTVRLPPAAATAAVRGDTEKVQGAGS